MTVRFKYDLAKDIENFFLVAKYSQQEFASPIRSRYEAQYGQELNTDKLRSFILAETKEQQLDLNSVTNQYQRDWDFVNDEFFKRCERLFNCALPSDEIIAYLTLCDRCGYNIKNNYFFISAKDNKPKLTTIHELWHFYTWHAFGQELQSLSPQDYYVLKEALTVIINHEFKDLLDGYDTGLGSHQEIRRKIENMWLLHKDLSAVIDEFKKSFFNYR